MSTISSRALIPFFVCFFLRFNLLASVDMRQDKDGLNSIKYEVVDTELNPLYTKIKVSYDKQALFAGIPLGTSKKQPKKF